MAGQARARKLGAAGHKVGAAGDSRIGAGVGMVCMNCRRYGGPGAGTADKGVAGGRDQDDQRLTRTQRVVCRGAVGGAPGACPWRHCEKNATDVQIRSLDPNVNNACSTCSAHIVISIHGNVTLTKSADRKLVMSKLSSLSFPSKGSHTSPSRDQH